MIFGFAKRRCSHGKDGRNWDVKNMHWACTAPRNNKHDFGKQQYIGVGGHLFAIAADVGKKWRSFLKKKWINLQFDAL